MAINTDAITNADPKLVGELTFKLVDWIDSQEDREVAILAVFVVALLCRSGLRETFLAAARNILASPHVRRRGKLSASAFFAEEELA